MKYIGLCIQNKQSKDYIAYILTPGLRRFFMKTEKIIKRYCSENKATKEQMWYYYPNLRAEFDYLEKKDPFFKKQMGKVPGKKV